LHSIDLFIRRRTNGGKYIIANEISLSKPKGFTKIVEIDDLITALVNEEDRQNYVWKEIETCL